MTRLGALSTMLVLAACVVTKGEPPVNEGLAYFEVELAEGTDLGSLDAPLPRQDEYAFVVDVSARDFDREVIEDYEGELEVRMQGATLSTDARIQLHGGRADDVRVAFRYAADREVITVHEVERSTSYDGSMTWRDTGRLGVSEAIYLPSATIAMIQSSHDGDPGSGFATRFNNRNLTLKGRQFVVTAVVGGGFIMTDLADPEYNSMYLYTYSTPYVDDVQSYRSLEVGTLIESVNGSVFEFFGFTEMSFPSFEPRRREDGSIVVDPSLVPAPKDITDLIDGGADEEIEKFESTVVVVRDVVVADFDPNDFSYIEYFQFPLQREASGEYIMAVTLNTVPSFVPTANIGRHIESVTGLLSQHRSARPSTWILTPRSSADIVFGE